MPSFGVCGPQTPSIGACGSQAPIDRAARPGRRRVRRRPGCKWGGWGRWGPGERDVPADADAGRVHVVGGGVPAVTPGMAQPLMRTVLPARDHPGEWAPDVLLVSPVRPTPPGRLRSLAARRSRGSMQAVLVGGPDVWEVIGAIRSAYPATLTRPNADNAHYVK
jgi:hypothetical protein